MKHAPVHKSHATAHITMKRPSPSHIMLDLAPAHSDRIQTALEHTHCRAQYCAVARSENTSVIETVRFQQLAPGGPRKSGGGVSRKRRVRLAIVVRVRFAHRDLVSHRLAEGNAPAVGS